MSFSEQDLRRRLEAVASQAGMPRFAVGDLVRRARRRRARATGAAAGSALAVAAIAVAVAVPAGQRGPTGPSGQSGPAAGAGAGAPVAYVASSDSGTVTLINTVTNRVERQLKVPGAGFIAVSPDGKTVYVTGSRGVTPISVRTGRAGRPMRVGRFPQYIAFTPSGKTAYVANYDSGTVTPISTATGRPGPAIPVGRDPEAIVVTAKTAYVASFGSGTVTPISTATNKAGPIRVRPTFSLLGGTPMVLTPNGKTVYVSTAHGVVPISTATNAAGKPIDAPTPLNPAENLVIMPDGSTVYASGVERLRHTISPVLHVTPIVSATGTELRSIKIGAGQGILAISPDGATVYALSLTGLTPIDTATNKPGKLIAFPGPQAIAITPDGSTAYVTGGGKGPVTPIRTATGTVLKPIKFGHSLGQTTIVIAPGR